MTLSGFHFIMLQRIITKIEKAGANSKEKAVTIEEAKLDSQEQQWLNYFAGAFLGEIKKTEDKRYYI
jgi:regulator of sigma D